MCLYRGTHQIKQQTRFHSTTLFLSPKYATRFHQDCAQFGTLSAFFPSHLLRILRGGISNRSARKAFLDPTAKNIRHNPMALARFGRFFTQQTIKIWTFVPETSQTALWSVRKAKFESVPTCWDEHFLQCWQQIHVILSNDSPFSSLLDQHPHLRNKDKDLGSGAKSWWPDFGWTCRHWRSLWASSNLWNG